MMSGLDTLFPAPRPVAFGGGTVDVFPLRLARLVAFSRAIRPALPLLLTGQIHVAIDQHFEDIRRSVSIATGLEEVALDQAWGDEFADLLAAVMEANLDFFVSRLVPALQRLVPVLTAMRASPTAPPMESSSSPPNSGSGDTTSRPSDA